MNGYRMGHWRLHIKGITFVGNTDHHHNARRLKIGKSTISWQSLGDQIAGKTKQKLMEGLEVF